jgi:RNA polymerase sigma-70 factor (ECF subfamily)
MSCEDCATSRGARRFELGSSPSSRIAPGRERNGRVARFRSPRSSGTSIGLRSGPEHFFDAAHPRWPRCWSTLVDGWAGVPEERLLSREVRGLVGRALGRLAPGQRAVMTLRDVEGWTAEEVCDFLRISPANQRVLLHRARARVREAIQSYLEEEGNAGGR